MKTLYKVLMLSAAVLSIASCNREEQYQFVPFASFLTSSAVVSEDAGTLSIPVSLRNSTAAANFLVKINNGSAVQNENFTLAEPANGVLTFAAGEESKNIVLDIINLSGVFTGALDFSIELAPATELAEVGNYNKVNISITDNDHPLVTNKVAGTYTAAQTGVTGSSGATANYSFTVHLTTDPEDVTIIWCDAICKFASDYNNGTDYKGRFSVYGIVSDDFNTITFPGLQPVSFSTGYGTLYLQGGARWSVNGDTGWYIGDETPVNIVFTRTATGWETGDGMAFIDNYVWPSYGGYILGENDGYKTVWTRIQ